MIQRKRKIELPTRLPSRENQPMRRKHFLYVGLVTIEVIFPLISVMGPVGYTSSEGEISGDRNTEESKMPVSHVLFLIGVAGVLFSGLLHSMICIKHLFEKYNWI
jgi:hypothetical protein